MKSFLTVFRFRWSLLCVLGLTALLAGSGCQTVPETGRRALHIMPESQLQMMAVQEFTRMKAEEPLSRDAAAVARVQRVGQRVAQVVADDMPGAQWEFVLFANDQVINAFAMPGGKVGVYTGLLKLCDSDDELAAVIGHEVAHVTLKHGNERVSQNMMASLGGIGVDIATRKQSQETRAAVQAAYGIGSSLAVLLPYSRLHEREADAVGVRYAARAGYDPRAAITFWQKMKAVGGGGEPPQFLSTHPSHEDRIQRLQALMPEAMREYEVARQRWGN